MMNRLAEGKKLAIIIRRRQNFDRRQLLQGLKDRNLTFTDDAPHRYFFSSAVAHLI